MTRVLTSVLLTFVLSLSFEFIHPLQSTNGGSKDSTTVVLKVPVTVGLPERKAKSKSKK